MSLHRSFRLALALTFGTAIAQAGDVIIAERPVAGHFPEIQAAVDAALEGESLLVTAGSYAPFMIDGKSVNVFVTGSGEVLITGQVRVKNLAPAQSVVLTRLKVKAASNQQQSPPPVIEIQNVSGHLRVLDSSFEGAAVHYLNFNVIYAGSGARIESSLNVVFSGCVIQGGSATGSYALEGLIDGGIGVDSVNASVALYNCTVQGGYGSEDSAPRGGHGGDAYKALSYGVFASGCSFSGGRGGVGDYVACCPSGLGGDGLQIDAGQAHLLADTATAGPAGLSCGGNSFPPAQPIHALNGALIDQIPGSRRTIYPASNVTSDDANLPITIQGQPGDLVFLMVARRPSFLFKKPLHGTWMIPTPMFSNSIPAGTIGPSGSLIVNRTFAIPDGTVLARQFYLQAMCVDTLGQATLTGPAHVLSLE